MLKHALEYWREIRHGHGQQQKANRKADRKPDREQVQLRRRAREDAEREVGDQQRADDG